MIAQRRLSRRQVLVAGGLASGLMLSGMWKSGAASGIKSSQRAELPSARQSRSRPCTPICGALEAGLDAAWSEIMKVEEAASLFSPQSALSRLNRDGTLSKAPAALIDMLTAAREVSDLTEGAFDVTVQPLWRLYDAAYKAGHAPSGDDLAAVHDLIGYRNVAVEADTVRLAKPGMALTLNGIAQGYATERCLSALSAHGIADAFLDTGEIGVAGKRDGAEPWTVGIADPRRDGQYLALTHPLSGVLATSGDYGTAFTPDFKAHHIFDPKTLQSPAQMASVSVLAQSGATADALATAMMVMAPEVSLALARRLGNVEVLLVTKDGATTRTAAFPIA